MSRFRFYFGNSLLCYFLRRAKNKWFTQEQAIPIEADFHGVRVCLEGLPERMRELIISHSYEKSEISLLSKHLKGHENVLEIGAAIGLVGLYCKKIKGIKHLASVEPNAITANRLRRNYTLNGMSPEIIEVAIYKEDVPVPMYVSDMFWTDSVIPNDDHSEGRSINVSGLTLAGLINQIHFDVDTLVIDVEGAEQYITISDMPPHVMLIFIELHPHIVGPKEGFRPLEEMIKAGFSIDDHLGDVWVLRREMRPKLTDALA